VHAGDEAAAGAARVALAFEAGVELMSHRAVFQHADGILENEAGDLYIPPRCPPSWDRRPADATPLTGPLVFGVRDPHDGHRLLLTHECERGGGHSVDLSLNLRRLSEEQAMAIVHAAVACGALSAGEAAKMGVRE
jgi:hypothetical protein